MLSIPTHIIDFFAKPIIIHVGTHDDQLQPWEVMAFGVTVSEDKQTTTVFVPAQIAAKTLGNLQSNGKVAVTFAEPASHESYQFKGRYLSHKDSTETEVAIQANVIQQFNQLFETFGRGPAYFAPIKYSPSVALTFSAEQIYVQTPGPGAGKQIL